jgi:hypothetical protein
MTKREPGGDNDKRTCLLQIVTYRLVSNQYMVFPDFVTAGKYWAVAVP